MSHFKMRSCGGGSAQAGFGGEGNAHGGDKEADQEEGVAGEKITFHNGAPEYEMK